MFMIYISLSVKDFAKNPTEMTPRDLKLDAEIPSQKITLSSDFIINIENEKYYYGCKFLRVCKKKIQNFSLQSRKIVVKFL